MKTKKKLWTNGCIIFVVIFSQGDGIGVTQRTATEAYTQ